MRLLTALLAACICASVAHADVPPEPQAESTVVVLTAGGQGSAFYIGNDIFTTAAHVVESEGTVELELSDGRKLLATVVFVNHVVDLAFVKVGRAVDIEAAKLTCRAAVLGEEVMLRGAPRGLRFVSTWGKIAGEGRKVAQWQAVVPVAIVAAPGNSGGPIFDQQGKVIGVLVGGALSGSSMFMALSVPSSLVCRARDYMGLE